MLMGLFPRCQLICSCWSMKLMLLQLPSGANVGVSVISSMLAQEVTEQNAGMTDFLCKHPAAMQADVQQVAELALQALHQKRPVAGGVRTCTYVGITACIG
jgi:hypothetical protein